MQASHSRKTTKVWVPVSWDGFEEILSEVDYSKNLFQSYDDKGYVKVSVDWPRTEKSGDPNYFYRTWLEKNIGKQENEWDWYVSIYADNELTLWFKNEKDAFTFLMVKDKLKSGNI